MFKKTVWAIFSVLLLQVFMFASSNLACATTIGEDVTYDLPIKSTMETLAEATYINNQLSAEALGTAALDLDGTEGKYAVKVTANDLAADSISYILVSSEAFNIDDYSQVQLWVKPGAGAQWLELSTATSAAKRYTVGVDLVCGRWNEISLNLKELAFDLSQGQNLNVKTDDASVWSFDNVTTIETKVINVDLNTMLNDKTEIANGGLQFKDNSATTFDAAPTVLSTDNLAIAQGKKITNININSVYANSGGDLSELPSSSLMQFTNPPTVYALSGYGKKLYYANQQDSRKLFRLDIMTGVSTKISDYIDVRNISSSYDGNVVVYKDQYQSGAYYYDAARAIGNRLGANNTLYTLANDGTVYYYYSSNNNNSYISYYLNCIKPGGAASLVSSGYNTIQDLKVSFDNKYLYLLVTEV